MGATLLSELLTEILISVAAVIGIAFSLLQYVLVSKVKVSPEHNALASNNKNGYGDCLIEEDEGMNDHNVVAKCAEIQTAISEGATSFIAISEGATSFLYTEYKYVGGFMIIFAILVFVFVGSVKSLGKKEQPCAYSKDKLCKPALANAGFSTISFLLGAITSLVSGFLVMKISTYAKARTNSKGKKGCRKSFYCCISVGYHDGISSCSERASCSVYHQ